MGGHQQRLTELAPFAARDSGTHANGRKRMCSGKIMSQPSAQPADGCEERHFVRAR